MKNFILTLSLLSAGFAGLLFFAPQPVHAQLPHIDSQTNAFAGTRGAGYASNKDPRLIVAGMIKIALSIVGIVFVGYTVYAGMVILISRGESEKVEKGKNTIRTGVIGIAVIMAAYSITAFVTNAILENTTTDPNGFRFWTSPGEPRQNQDPLNPETPLRGPYYDNSDDSGSYYISP